VGAGWQGADGHTPYCGLRGDRSGRNIALIIDDAIRKETKVTEIITYAPGVGIIQRDETFPQLVDLATETRAPGHTVLRLKEWKTVAARPAAES
jgi:hypothetical protein